MLMNTPDAFTPDGGWILGEAPEIGNYYICAGMNGNSLQGAGGVGKAVADWMVSNFFDSVGILNLDVSGFQMVESRLGPEWSRFQMVH